MGHAPRVERAYAGAIPPRGRLLGVLQGGAAPGGHQTSGPRISDTPRWRPPGQGGGPATAPGGSPPHPPFGHLLPAGEKGTVCDSAQQADLRRANRRSPSPHRGEGWGEGARTLVIAENARKLADRAKAVRQTVLSA